MTRYAATAATTPTRSSERMTYDADAVHAILDEALIGHLGFVAEAKPIVLPTIHARVGSRLYLHGSTGARPLLTALREDGLDVCYTATIVDGLVLAKSAFHHSMNYRSVVAHGHARLVTDATERALALDAVVEHVVAGRSQDTRRPNARELAATSVLRLDLAAVGAKVRTGGPVDDDADLGLPHWAGVLPVRTAFGAPQPCQAAPLPDYLASYPG